MTASVGFGAGGVVAGSVAAAGQSMIYGAYTGGIFSTLQSAGEKIPKYLITCLWLNLLLISRVDNDKGSTFASTRLEWISTNSKHDRIRLIRIRIRQD